MFFIPNVNKLRFETSWMPAVLGALGIVSLFLLIGTNWMRERLVAVDMLRLDALVEIQLSVSTVHLWLEEYVTGDDVHLADIENGLARANKLCQTLIQGGYLEGIDVELPPLDSALSIRQSMTMQGHLERFKELSQIRQDGFENGDDVGIGSAMDVEYDAVFNEFLRASADIEKTTRDMLADNIARVRVLFRTMLLVWGIIVVLAIAGLWVRDVRRRNTAQQLARTEAQLHHSQKMDAVGRLASGITHDINNYLAAIRSNCELVQMRSEPGDPVANKMAVIVGVVDRASGLINKLLEFSQQKPRQTKVVDLNQLITDLQAMLCQLAGTSIEIEFNLQQELWNTELDPGQLEQIVMNLVVNAAQAMPDGGKLRIETSNAVLDKDFTARHTIVSPGDYALLTVSDTGAGVPVDIQDKIFEPFFTTKDHSTNSGLGLSTVYGLVIQNQGHIWLYSEPPNGAMFKIYLPRAYSTAEQKVDRLARRPIVKAGSEGVLFVEDNDDFRVSTRAMLGELGYRVIAAKNGKEALSIFADHRSQIDLVITDIVMPEMGGKELVEIMRAQGDHIPVIFVSGYSENVTLSDGLLNGEITLLQKPFSVESLANNIRKALDSVAP